MYKKIENKNLKLKKTLKITKKQVGKNVQKYVKKCKFLVI